MTISRGRKFASFESPTKRLNVIAIAIVGEIRRLATMPRIENSPYEYINTGKHRI